MSDALPMSPAEFEQALRAKGAYYHIHHPYHVAMYQGRAVVELDNALWVQQHMAFLRRLVLEAVTGAPVRHLITVETHRVIPLSQTRSPVTL